MAPNADDYGSSSARAIATGTGQIIRGISWVRDSIVEQLEKGTICMKSKLNSNDKPSTITLKALWNTKRVRNISRATANVVRGVNGNVKEAKFMSRHDRQLIKKGRRFSSR
ncbi:senescence/dehydration-associated protein At3g51250-like [Physcomitrium patens]|uniref:senescence/dehydration-associated protein At3g51250-like n=1 Tax=Physcomitrium patens TaxID=3218 RepID=UPI00024B0F97